jgi:hypothetical protein
MISSNPYHPLCLQRELLTHGWGSHGGWWRDVGDDGDEDLLQIPVPAGCQNGFSNFESRFLMVAAQWKSIWENAEPLLLSGQRVYVGGRRGRGDSRGGLTTGGRGQAWATPPGGEPSHCPLSSLLLSPWVFWQNRFFAIFSGIFLESWISAQKQDTRAILLKTAWVRVSCIQNTQIRGETIAKMFGKVGTFWTYQ